MVAKIRTSQSCESARNCWRLNGDDNGSSHVRAGLLGPSVTVPFSRGKLHVGTWQQIMLMEFDTGPRQRDVVVQIVGE